LMQTTMFIAGLRAGLGSPCEGLFFSLNPAPQYVNQALLGQCDLAVI